MMDEYYIYVHLKLSSGEPFYVGKGKGDRFLSKQRSEWWHRTVKKHGYDVLFLEKNLSEKEAYRREKYWINKIGRKDKGLGTLINMTDGGEGTSGRIFKHSEGSKDKMRLANLGKKHSEGSKDLISRKLSGNKNAKRILVVDDSTGIVYDSISEAARDLNLDVTTLWKYLKGLRKNKTNLRLL